MDINELFKQAKNDPSLLSNINIDELLNDTDDVKNDYLQNKTINNIQEDVYDSLEEVFKIDEDIVIHMDKLRDYRVVDEVSELHNGKHIRWIRKGTTKLTNGGIVVEVKFIENGINVLCKNAMHKFIKIKYDECIIFQKLTIDEQIILTVNQHVTSEETT